MNPAARLCAAALAIEFDDVSSTEPRLAVHRVRRMEHVLRTETGIIEQASTVLGSDYAAVQRLRSAIEDARVARSTPLFVCPSCGSPLGLRHDPNRRMGSKDPQAFHFAHGANRACDLAQEKGWSQAKINAARYHGQRESEPHKRMKEMVAESLKHDPSFRDVAIEQRWRHGTDPQQWRRPDVSAQHVSGPMAFEVQLSTTFLSVMAERRHFYASEGAMLMWIVSHFDPEFTRAGFEDIFYPNNRNIFIVSPETVAASAEQKAFVVEVVYTIPVLTPEGLREPVERKLVRFDQLTQDRVHQRIFHIDVDKAIPAALIAAKRINVGELLRAFIASPGHPADAWAAVVAEAERNGVASLPPWREVNPLAKTLYRLMNREKNFAWQHATIAELGHHLHTLYPEQLVIFQAAIEALSLGTVVRSERAAPSLRDKLAAVNQALRAGDRRFVPPLWAVEVARMLCPSIYGPLEARLRALPEFP